MSDNLAGGAPDANQGDIVEVYLGGGWVRGCVRSTTTTGAPAVLSLDNQCIDVHALAWRKVVPT